MRTLVVVSALVALCYGCSCPEGWSYLRITDHCYRLFPERKNYEDAKASCKAEGGYLPDIQSAAENSFVRLVAFQGADQRWGWLPWIGAYTDTPGTPNNDQLQWHWEDGMPMTYTNWCPMNPSGYWERCVQMLSDNCPICGNQFRMGCWNNIGCESQLPYVCKRPTN
ncbi:hypothetical protein QR680_016055 [Steinernema hermaphroditum]|uniref:C-type lectin domain-containing protein n=1 Tax=Steinernema hermaphroditum TaxID=289476 RepID=A0AA39HA50_9BILA|nr:hypothetical protein QR680_016055 [Steinernema hermaphroditum]